MEVQLDPTGWFLEEEKKTEEAINHLRNVLGTYECETNTTYARLEGYLSGIKAMHRKFDDVPVKVTEAPAITTPNQAVPLPYIPTGPSNVCHHGVIGICLLCQGGHKPGMGGVSVR